MSKTTISVKATPNGQMEIKPGNTLNSSKRAALPPTPEDFVPAHDPDNLPLMVERQAKRLRLARAGTLRRQLGLTQEEFSRHYQIPLGTLHDWEQRRSEPDSTARAFLKVIASDPEGVAHALSRELKPAAE